MQVYHAAPTALQLLVPSQEPANSRGGGRGVGLAWEGWANVVEREPGTLTSPAGDGGRRKCPSLT